MLTPNNPRITIIIGVLNMRDSLSKTLDSVINQHYKNLEILIFDGKSTDGTLDVIKKYEKNLTFWKSEKDRGHTDACNHGIDIATGDLIHFLNADDLLEPGLLHKVAKVYQNNKDAQIISCGATITYQGHTIKTYCSPEELQISLSNVLFGLPLTNTRFFRKTIFEKFGKFPAIDENGKYNIANDREFFINLALNNIKTKIIPEPLYHYFSHSQSLTFSNRNAIRIIQEHIKIAKKELKKHNLSAYQRRLFNIWLAQEWLRLAWVHLKQKKFADSLNAIVKGIWHQPIVWFKQAMQMGIKWMTKN